MGYDSLGKTVKQLCAKAGIEEFFTNQSLRHWCASRLFQEGAKEQIILYVTSHRSIDCVKSYKMISDKQLQATSNILKLKKPKIKLNEECMW